MAKYINLIEYLPPFIADYREMQEIMSAENPEFVLTAKEYDRLLDNQFIISCDEVGISRFEKILGIVPTANDTLQSRISRVLIRWNDTVPYTWKAFLQKLQTLCGDDFEVIPDWNNYTLKIITHLDLYGQVDELENILEYMPPSNILINANNTLNYMGSGCLFLGSGAAYAGFFQLTDSYKVTWNQRGVIYPVAGGSGTCEITMTDSFKQMNLSSEAKHGSVVHPGITEQIEVSDTSKDAISVGSAANTANIVAYTEVI